MRKVIGYLQKQTTFRTCFKATLAAGNMLVIFLVVCRFYYLEKFHQNLSQNRVKRYVFDKKTFIFVKYTISI